MERNSIAIVAAHFYPHLGGVEQYVYHIADGLRKSGYQPTIITSSVSGQPAEELYKGIPVYRIPSFWILQNEFPIPTIRGFFITRRIFRKLAPSTLITNTRYFPIHVTAIFALGNQKSHHIHIEHGSKPLVFQGALTSFFAQLYDSLFGKWVVHHADKRFGVSRAVMSFIQRQFHCTVQGILTNAVDQSFASKRSGDDRMNENVQAVVFGYLGRLIEEKGVLLLIRAFKNAFANSTSTQLHPKLIICGSGPLRDEVSQEVSGNDDIEFIGSLEATRIQHFYNHIDVLCLPTWYPEGFSTVLLEASIFGKYIITTTAGSAEEIVLNRQFGKLVNQRSMQSLCEALCLASKEIPPGYFNAALQQHVLRHFTWESTVKKLIHEL